MSEQPTATEKKWRDALKWVCRGLGVLGLAVVAASLLEATTIVDLPAIKGVKLTQDVGIGMAGLGYLLNVVVGLSLK